MRIKAYRGAAFVAAWALLGAAPQAWAGVAIYGTIDYEPLSVATVPTLSQWALVAMGLLLAVLAYRALRGRIHGRLLTHLLLGGGLAAAGGWAGTGGVPSAQAAPPVEDTVALSQASGGTANITVLGVSEVENTSAVALRIKALNSTAQWINPEPGHAPQCVVGMVLQPGGTCYVELAAE
ncbi:MAG: midcut-by-XrtH protein [Burkholderiaceae bacterium]